MTFRQGPGPWRGVKQWRDIPTALRGEPAEVPTVRALEFVRRMRGASQPCLLHCDNGASYVVKFQNNPQHVRVLANEMLASRLALLVGLPVPAPAFVEVPVELIERNPGLTLEFGSARQPCVPGLHFGSRFPAFPAKPWCSIFSLTACYAGSRICPPFFLADSSLTSGPVTAMDAR